MVASKTSKGSFGLSFFTSPTAEPGLTKMRVSMKKGTAIPTSCETFAAGEVEDYTVNISGGVSNARRGLLNVQEEVSSVLVYPNPTTGTLTIEMPVTKEGYDYRLVSLTGRVLQTGNIIAATSTLDLSEIDRGIYFLQVTSKEKTEVIKVVKH